ncbi:hypothetical protein, partial [Mesorhizobium sp. M0060]|uniref:hypothetical protein n=1 Tax=Mesorhizobium sp. M0060 TaxID=2956866 RepID=UPI00333CF693
KFKPTCDLAAPSANVRNLHTLAGRHVQPSAYDKAREAPAGMESGQGNRVFFVSLLPFRKTGRCYPCMATLHGQNPVRRGFGMPIHRKAENAGVSSHPRWRCWAAFSIG